MLCFDCAHTESREDTTVVGVCSVCGAALCGEHAHVCEHRDRHLAGMGGAVPTSPPGRRLCCTTCRDAGRTGSQYDVGHGVG